MLIYILKVLHFKGMMYWGWSGNGEASSSAIEAASYALLAQLQLDDLQASTEIAGFLLMHRTSGRAFSRTRTQVISRQCFDFLGGNQTATRFNIPYLRQCFVVVFFCLFFCSFFFFFFFCRGRGGDCQTATIFNIPHFNSLFFLLRQA